MINVGNKKVGRFFIGATTHSTVSIGSVHLGTKSAEAQKIWEAISSCFGSGKWRPSKPWRGRDKWKY